MDLDVEMIDVWDIAVIAAGIITGILVFFMFTGFPTGGDATNLRPPTTAPAGTDDPERGPTYDLNISLGDAPGEPIEAYITAIYEEDYQRAYNQLAPRTQQVTPFPSWRQQMEELREEHVEEQNQAYTFQRIEEVLPTSQTAADIRFSVHIARAGRTAAVSTDTVAATLVQGGEWKLREAFPPYF